LKKLFLKNFINARIELSITKMFSLLTGFWHYLFSKQEYNVLILGLDNSGKTTLLEELKRVKPPSKPYTSHEDEDKIKVGRSINHSSTGEAEKPRRQVSPTVGLNVGRYEDQEIILRFWDLGGQKALRTIWDRYYQEANALIFVVDSTDHKRSEEAQHEFKKLINHPDLSNIPILIIGNKRDSLAKYISNRELASCLGIKFSGHGIRIRRPSLRATTWPEGISPPATIRNEPGDTPIGSAIRRVNSGDAPIGCAIRRVNSARILSTPVVQTISSPRLANHRSKAGEPTISPIAATFRQLITPPAPPQTPSHLPFSEDIFLPCHFESRLIHIMQTSVVRRRDLNHVIRFLCVSLSRLREQTG